MIGGRVSVSLCICMGVYAASTCTWGLVSVLKCLCAPAWYVGISGLSWCKYVS